MMIRVAFPDWPWPRQVAAWAGFCADVAYQHLARERHPHGQDQRRTVTGTRLTLKAEASERDLTVGFGAEPPVWLEPRKLANWRTG